MSMEGELILDKIPQLCSQPQLLEPPVAVQCNAMRNKLMKIYMYVCVCGSGDVLQSASGRKMKHGGGAYTYVNKA
jgi:hypothetical protein